MRHFGSLHFFGGLIGAISVAGGLFAAGAALAQDCPGNPDAIGTSRVLTVEPGELTHVGVMQYPQSLPLADKEVVLTFDDGPLPPYSNQILDILASQCVKVTYFLVGEMARAYPATARRMFEEGHTIGTHSENHPLRFDRLSTDKVRWEIDQGIEDVAAALGDPDDVAPFFRIPGLGRTPVVESELSARSLVVFSSDTVADDWFRRIKPDQIITRAINRLEKLGGGILLLHDIHKSTAAALPGLLKELKAHGFRIVHVVPARTDAPLVAGLPKVWAVALSASDPFVAHNDGAEPTWPIANAELEAERVALPAPDPSTFEPDYPIELMSGRGRDTAGDGTVRWPDQPQVALATAEPSPAAEGGHNFGARPEGEHDSDKMFGLRPNLEANESDIAGCDMTGCVGITARVMRRPPIGEAPDFHQADEP
jgi:peptidoglycan/xylan/chitin deacetylase (PgdA/CDA1 family)